MNVASKLTDLAKFTSVVNLKKGESLTKDQGCGLYFIEHGILVGTQYQKYCNVHNVDS